MKFVKPAWVAHGESANKPEHSGKRQTIYSIHVHPDGSRIATGGLDAKIRIWSTKPILNPLSDASGKPPKSLCTLAMHTGPVLAVRWAHSGRWLASGSDDQIVMIWDLDPHARGRVWGSDEVNVEGWKPLKRLPGHESDVVDMAWSPADRHLASVGLDSAVFIWCGYTLERLRRIDQHQGFVKGVCWDPVGEFLATQSDDKSVKIWRTSDWGLEADVTKPFEDSPTSTFFRRLSWSPDGAHITASNATNNRGFVFIAAVITRGTWTSEISLVGHENAVQVAAYNPHIFLRDSSQPVATSNICSVVALGADDNSVSIWQTKCARPLIVAKEVFDRQILDLSWSWDGLVLYAASSDGSIAAFQFDASELDGIASHSVQEQYLQKFNFTPPPPPAGYSHTVSTQPVSTPTPSQPAASNGMQNSSANSVHKLVAKRRKPPTHASQVPSAGTHVNGSGGGPKRATLISHSGSTPQGGTAAPVQPIPYHQQPQASTSKEHMFPTEDEQPFGDPENRDHRGSIWGQNPMDVDASSISVTNSKGDGGLSRAGTDQKTIKARTLGGDRPRDVIAPKILDQTPVDWGSSRLDLPIPTLSNVITVSVDSNERFEARNREQDEVVFEVISYHKEDIVFADYLPSPILLLAASPKVCAAAMQDGTIVTWSRPFGRRLSPPLVTGSPPSTIEISEYALLAVASSGMVFSWNMKSGTAFFPPTSLSTVLSGFPNRRITTVSVQSNGVPTVICSDASAFSYHPAMCCWVQLSDKWWSQGAESWPSRPRTTSTASSSRGVVSWIDGQVAQATSLESVEAAAGKIRPNTWNTTLTLAHLETRLHSAMLLDSREEYRQTLMAYARRIADEGFKGMAEDLIKDLFGPVYWKPGRDESWSPTVVGFSKRELLKDVLSLFAKSRSLKKLGTDWQDTLKKASVE